MISGRTVDVLKSQLKQRYENELKNSVITGILRSFYYAGIKASWRARKDPVNTMNLEFTQAKKIERQENFLGLRDILTLVFKYKQIILTVFILITLNALAFRLRDLLIKYRSYSSGFYEQEEGRQVSGSDWTSLRGQSHHGWDHTAAGLEHLSRRLTWNEGLFYLGLNEIAMVPHDWKISLQLVSELMTSGWTVDVLRAQLKQRYENEVENPAITVILRSFYNAGIKASWRARERSR